MPTVPVKSRLPKQAPYHSRRCPNTPRHLETVGCTDQEDPQYGDQLVARTLASKIRHTYRAIAYPCTKSRLANYPIKSLVFHSNSLLQVAHSSSAGPASMSGDLRGQNSDTRRPRTVSCDYPEDTN
ncbi:uncharacterized protein PHACADRAFT_190905 [Phanerochaete carnosa HHB-10118-sp]|uniref:Uncharacterized protein n=1 Tax=Phanerochaete carnosa (strain HHB-10118-sp) TaxID=650164 RepID=K5WQG1_PHACS|nr:uncharacterized protein PHACADRAFT_190905 [Phanerochaete carnosa HHB-10118-sp]EKM61720.1 hypothetical protein PHACADRAFT_190905 [Phanerochaete carnosa HHB-10118-sp]